MLREGATPKYSIYVASDLVVPVYRVVSKAEPDADDFLPYLLGNRPFPAKLFFRATGVSMFAKRREAVKLARGGKIGTFVAELRLEDDVIHFAVTNERTGHLDVWAPTRVLLNSVVSCVDTGKG